MLQLSPYLWGDSNAVTEGEGLNTGEYSEDGARLGKGHEPTGSG